MLWILELITTWSMLIASGSAISLTFTLAPSSVVGGNSTTGTITLSSPAPAGGTSVIITNPPGTTVQAGAAQVGNIQSEGSTKIAVAEGARTVTFRVNTAGVASSSTATFKATSGTDATSATLTILPASIRAVTITPINVVGGQSVSAQIALDGAAAIGTGTTVQLAASSSSRDPSLPAAPTTAHFPPGSRSVTVPVTTSPVPADQATQITATLGASTSSGSFVITAPVVASLFLNPSTVVSGNGTTGTLKLNGPASAQGTPVVLSSSNASVTVPSSITVNGGSNEQTFPVTTAATTVGATVTIVSHNKVREAASRVSDGTSNTIQISEFSEATHIGSATLTLLPAPVLGSFTLRPTTVKGGASVIAELQLLPNVTSAQTITLTADQANDVQLPATVSVLASGVPTPFTITTHDVNKRTIVTITATAGTQSIPVVLTINK